jgi:ketosteroid isomerase-like protein/quercetin dioxygenase-like cupin family protein
MMTRALILRSLLTIPVAACASATSAGNTADETSAIRATNRQFEQAIAARDAATLATFYAPDARVNPPNAPTVTGAAAIQGLWQDAFRIPDFQLAFTPERLDIATSGDMALDAGVFRFRGTGPDGPMTEEGNYAVTWRKTAEGWKIVSEMWHSSRPVTPPAAAAVAAPKPAAGDGAEMEILAARGLKWGPLEVPGFKPGIEIAAIHGDPSSEGDYTVRLRFPAGYAFPSHWHPNGEHLTVLRGTFRLGMGEKENPAALKTYLPGDFLYIPAKMAHFGGVQGPTEIQLHGTGPFQVILATQP